MTLILILDATCRKYAREVALSWEMYIGTMTCLMLLLGSLLLLVKQWNGNGMHDSCVIWTLIQRGRYASQVENVRSTHSIQVEYRLDVCSIITYHILLE